MIFGTNFQKVYFRSKTEKNYYYYWILHIWISLSTNFQLKLTIAIFWTKFTKKGSYFQSKADKIDSILHIRISLCIKFHFEQFWIFGPNLPNKDIVKNWKSEHHWIPLIQISLGTKFRLKLTILIFWPDLPKKGFSGLKQKKSTPHVFYIILLRIQISLARNFSSNWQLLFLDQIYTERYFRSKTEKVNIIIKFRLFKLVLVSTFGLNWQFWFFWPDLPKNCFSGLKQKKWTPHFLRNSAYSN